MPPQTNKPAYYLQDSKGNLVLVSPNDPLEFDENGNPRKVPGASLSDLLYEQAKEVPAQVAKKEIGNAIGNQLEGASLSSLLGGGSSASAMPIPGQVVGSVGPGQALLADGVGGASVGMAPVGGTEVLGSSAPGAFDMAGIGQGGNLILPVAGLAGAYDLFANRPQNLGHGSGLSLIHI